MKIKDGIGKKREVERERGRERADALKEQWRKRET